MRIYRFNSGEQHFIFFDNLEAISYLTSDKYKHLNVNSQDLSEQEFAFEHWTNPLVQIGDWVRTCDGRIVQVLKTYELLGKKKRNTKAQKQFARWSVKVCFGIYTWFIKANGEMEMYQKMMADPRTIFEENGAGQNKVTGKKWVAGRYLTKDKRIFAYWFQLTLDPLFALSKTSLKKHWKSKRTATEAAFELAKDPYVLEEMSTYKPMSEIQKTIKELLAEKGLSREVAIEHLAKGLEANIKPVEILDKDGNVIATKDNPKTGGKNHRDWTELLFKVTEWAENEGKPNAPQGLLSDKINKPASLTSVGAGDIEEEFTIPDKRKELVEATYTVTPSSSINSQRKEI